LRYSGWTSNSATTAHQPAIDFDRYRIAQTTNIYQKKNKCVILLSVELFIMEGALKSYIVVQVASPDAIIPSFIGYSIRVFLHLPYRSTFLPSSSSFPFDLFYKSGPALAPFSFFG
jgi:hypothetical protein